MYSGVDRTQTDDVNFRVIVPHLISRDPGILIQCTDTNRFLLGQKRCGSLASSSPQAPRVSVSSLLSSESLTS